MAGQTDADYYFKATVNSSGAVTDSSCLSRSDQWANNYSYKLYNANTGAAISLNAGYGFETDDGVRGYVGTWGAWFDDDPSNADDGNPFSPSNTSITATKNSDDSAVTLYWSPGQLFSREASTASDTAIERKTSEGVTTGFWPSSIWARKVI